MLFEYLVVRGPAHAPVAAMRMKGKLRGRQKATSRPSSLGSITDKWSHLPTTTYEQPEVVGQLLEAHVAGDEFEERVAGLCAGIVKHLLLVEAFQVETLEGGARDRAVQLACLLQKLSVATVL